ncbi:restriction endonuclease subunit S, partial [Vibrio vulnificus]|nr:restriction endonuclease subunit S [Vibrio vulnificus]
MSKSRLRLRRLVMLSNWETKRISDVCEYKNNKRVPIKSIDRAKRQGGYPYYGASGIVDYIDDYIFDGTYLLISEDGENLRTRNTPIAFKATGQFWVNNHAHILTEKEDGILDYLEYYFSCTSLTPYLTGAVQPKL